MGSMSNDFTEDEKSEISLNGSLYHFWIDHNSIKRENMLNIYQYLIVKNNMK